MALKLAQGSRSSRAGRLARALLGPLIVTAEKRHPGAERYLVMLGTGDSILLLGRRSGRIARSAHYVDAD